MKFPRTKKLVFCNNKGGVGKTTLAFNCASAFAKKGYKTAMIDLDPQCNLSLLSLGYQYFENNLFSNQKKNVFDVLSGIIEGGRDIDLSVRWEEIEPNLYLLPGSLKLSNFENLLTTSYGLAAGGQQLGYFHTSAIDRFLKEKGLSDEIDIFVIDTSPNLGILNRVIFLGADYFAVPMMPDAFSVQGVENLGTIFEEWKINWKNSAKALAGDIPQKNILQGEAIFIGYIINSYNVYGKKPIKKHRDWMQEIHPRVKKYLSEKHCKNGLVEQSWKNPLDIIQDYGQLAAFCQEKCSAIFNLNAEEVLKFKQGTKENVEKSKEEFNRLSDKILEILKNY